MENKNIKQLQELDVRPIFSTVFGSRLYGTNTSISDVDFKTIYLPSVKSLITGTAKLTDSMRSNWIVDDTEYEDEVMSLHKFYKLAVEGQTMAIDMLWAPEDMWESSENWDLWKQYVVPHRSKFITSSMNAFIGYAVSQAVKYSNKGNRLNNLEACFDYLSLFDPHRHLDEAIQKVIDKDFTYKIYDAKDRMSKSPVMMMEINGIKFNLNVDIKFVTECLKGHLKKYGNRARTASLDNGADYKAISHAFRTIMEVEELITTGNIEFPLKLSNQLLSIKQGKIHNIEQTIEFLMSEVDRVTDLMHNSNLPVKPNITAEEVILPFYTNKLIM